MSKKDKINPAEYVIPININGMHGRMLKTPAPQKRKREILLVYGMHASIERMFGFVEELSQYGAITMPDLPGFGGMDSFYKIGEVPTLDKLADYLASFVQLQYKRKHVTILGMSYGFIIVTRMLQKYPQLVTKVDLLVSLVGFVHHEDFRLRKRDLRALKTVSWIGSKYVPSLLLKYLVFTGPPVRLTYRLAAKNHRKLHDADNEELKKRIDFEIQLWKQNDARTRAQVAKDMLQVNLCHEQVGLSVCHVAITDDHFFDNRVVEQHMRIIYTDFEMLSAKIPGKHAPTVIADTEAVAPFVPKKLRRMLAKKT